MSLLFSLLFSFLSFFFLAFPFSLLIFPFFLCLNFISFLKGLSRLKAKKQHGTLDNKNQGKNAEFAKNSLLTRRIIGGTYVLRSSSVALRFFFIFYCFFFIFYCFFLIFYCFFFIFYCFFFIFYCFFFIFYCFFFIFFFFFSFLNVETFLYPIF